MSLNTSHTDGGVVIHQGEIILLHAPSTVVSFSGSDDLKKFVEVTGNSYLTTHRLIFLTKGTKSNLRSFSFPFCVLSEVDVEQPVFGSNYLKGKVRAQPNGNWRGEAKWKLQFKAGGAIDFAQGMLKAIHVARQVSAQNQYWNEPPPAYAAANFMPAPTSYYAPPPSYYGWNYSPTGHNFPAPEAGTVYISENPPPYPGIGGGFQQQPQQGYGGAYQQQPQQGYGGGYQQQPEQGYGGGYQQLQGYGSAYPQQAFGFQQCGIIQQQGTFVAGTDVGYMPPPYQNGYPPMAQGAFPPAGAVPPPYQQQYNPPVANASTQTQQQPPTNGLATIRFKVRERDFKKYRCQSCGKYYSKPGPLQLHEYKCDGKSRKQKKLERKRNKLQ